MADDINETLARILHEVVDGRRILEHRIESVERKLDALRGETLSHFDAIDA